MHLVDDMTKLKAIRQLFLDLMRPLDYYACYVAEVVKQNEDSSLDLKFEDVRLPETGATKVPITTGIPGVTFSVNAGSRCVVAFRNGKASDPHVVGWIDTTPDTIWVTADTEVRVIADTIIGVASQIRLGSDGSTLKAAIAELVKAEMEAHNVWATLHIHTDPVSGTTGVSTTAPPAIGEMGSSVVRLDS